MPLFSDDHPLRQSCVFEPFVLCMAWLCSMFVLGLVTKGVAPMLGIQDLQGVLEDLEGNLTPDLVSAMRILQLLGQILLFILPAVLFLAFCNARKPFRYLFLDEVPQLRNIFLGLALMFTAIPVIQFIYWLNMQLPLPAFMQNAEENSNGLIEAMLKTDSIEGLLMNLLTVALLPAIGEELLFRGVIQRIIAKLRANPHKAIWITGVLFSLMHFQFAGFVPRLLLGALLGYMLYWSGTLIVPMLAHFFYNASQVVAVHLHHNEKVATNIENIEQFPIVLTIISVILVVVLCRLMYKINETQRMLYETRMEESIQ